MIINEYWLITKIKSDTESIGNIFHWLINLISLLLYHIEIRLSI